MDPAIKTPITTSPIPNLVSIIMLTYNRADYITLAIDSVLTQTYKNWELIIIDDGSTDHTAEVVKKYTDPRIRYIKKSQNRGLFYRRYESLSYVRGEFVAILDSDDMWIDNEKLQKQVAHMRAHTNCAVVGTFIKLIDDQGNTTGTNNYKTNDHTIRRSILFRNQFANSSVVMRTSSLAHTAGYRNYSPSEDHELFLQLGRVGTFANLPDFSLAYRIHPGGESARKAKVAKQVLRVIRQHAHSYPGALFAYIKFSLLYLAARLYLV